MSTRNVKLMSLAVTLALVACEPQPAIPTAPTVVRLAVMAGADHGGRPYSTSMTQEATFQPPYAGDSDGVGEAILTINLGQREVCWETTVSNAPAGLNGNNVDLTAETTASVDTELAYQLALRAAGDRFTLYRTAIKGA